MTTPVCETTPWRPSRWFMETSAMRSGSRNNFAKSPRKNFAKTFSDQS